MFTASHFKLFRKYCPEKLAQLLKLLDIPEPDFSNGDEYEHYQKLDTDIENVLKRCLHAESIIAGCSHLLSMGNIEHNKYDAIDNLIGKVNQNRQRILSGNIDVVKAERCMDKDGGESIQEFLAMLSINDNYKAVQHYLENQIKHVKKVFEDIKIAPIAKRKLAISSEAKLNIAEVLRKEIGSLSGREIVISVIDKQTVSSFSEEELENIFNRITCINDMFEAIKKD